jgi:alpha-glucosidase
VFGGPAWEWDARRGQYYLHNFLREQPDLNVHNPEVQDALLATSRFWLERGVDGFRFDAINFAMHDPLLRDNPPAPDTGKPRSRPFDFQLSVYNKSHTDIPRFIRRLRALLDSYPDRFSVAEVGGPSAEAEMQRFIAGTEHFHTAYGFNFLNSDEATPQLIQEALTAWPDETHIGWPSWAFSNHDAPRVASRWADKDDREASARLSMLLLASLRGNIFIYQGEELGLPQAHIPFEQLKDPEAIANWPLTLGRDGARTLIPWTSNPDDFANSWLPVPTEHLELAVEHQSKSEDSMFAFTRRVLKLRSASDALLVGSMTVLHAQDGVLAFERATEGERMLCVFNLSSESRRWVPPNSGSWQIVLAANQQDGADPWRIEKLSGFVARKNFRHDQRD